MLKYIWYLLLLYVNSSVKCLKLFENCKFPIFSLFWQPILYHSSGISLINTRLLYFCFYFYIDQTLLSQTTEKVKSLVAWT